MLVFIYKVIISANLARNNRNHHSVVTNSGKNIYAEATGEVVTYVLVQGLIEIARNAYTLSGICCAIK